MASTPEEIQLSWLRAFLAVYNTGSFTAAARYVHRAQSRVSGQIAQLEHHVGTQLFVRGRQPASLTEAGREFLPYVQAVLHDVEAGVAAVSSHEGAVRGRVTVATYPGASALVLAPLIKLFRERHPDAQVELRDALGFEPEVFVVHGDVDLAVRASEPAIAPHSLLVSRPLFREPIVCLLPADHPAAVGQSVTADVFADADVVMTGAVGIPGGHYSHLLSAADVRPATETVVGQPTTVAALVDAGLGVGILPALAARLLDTADRVSILPVAVSGWVRDVLILTNRARRYPPVVEAFIRELLAMPTHPALEPAAATDRRENRRES